MAEIGAATTEVRAAKQAARAAMVEVSATTMDVRVAK